jgi:hypothetical protein
MPFDIINLDVVSLFTNLSFSFLAVLNFYLNLIYSINFNNEYTPLFMNMIWGKDSFGKYS